MKSTNASSVQFGFDFQSNAAIMLMLKNIKIADSVKVEGETEDIEIKLNNGNVIYSQAKSVFNPYDDFGNVLAKLEAAIKSLSSAGEERDVEQLIYVTNSPNPFNKKETIGAFSDSLSIIKYSDLPMSCQQQINKICVSKGYHLNTSLFSVYVMQFCGDQENRYKVVKGLVNEFLHNVGLGERGFGQSMLEIWQRWFTINASQHDISLTITKKSMIWPLIVSICNVNSEDAILSNYDEGEVEHIIERYQSIIVNQSERFEFVTKVLSAYSLYRVNVRGDERIKSFVSDHWVDFCDDFDIQHDENDIVEPIVKLAISNVIRRHKNIVKIKQEVNL